MLASSTLTDDGNCKDTSGVVTHDTHSRYSGKKRRACAENTNNDDDVMMIKMMVTVVSLNMPVAMGMMTYHLVI